MIRLTVAITIIQINRRTFESLAQVLSIW